MAESLFYFLFFTLILLACQATSYGIGVSPDKLVFSQKEAKLFVFNTNSFEVNYSISGCEGFSLEFLKSGAIASDSRRELLFRHNYTSIPEKNCSLEIYFSNNVYSTGVSMPVIFKFIEANKSVAQSKIANPFLQADSFNETSTKQGNTSNSQLLVIVLVGIIFLVLIFIIIRFL